METRKKMALVAGLVLFVVGLVLMAGGPAIANVDSGSTAGKSTAWAGIASTLVGMALVGGSLMGK